MKDCTPHPNISLSVLPVSLSHQKDPSNSVIVYAMLDPCSQGTFIDESLVDRLDLNDFAVHSHVTVKTINGETRTTAGAVKNLVVRSTTLPDNQRVGVKLPVTYTQSELPFAIEDVPSPKDLSQWPQLGSIVDLIAERDSTIPFGLLIGANCIRAMEPMEIIPSSQGSPYAYRSRLGWCVVGPSSDRGTRSISCNRIQTKLASLDASSNELRYNHQVPYNEIKDSTIGRALEDMYNVEFVERNSEKTAPSRDDNLFLSTMEENVRFENGHFTLPLPFRDEFRSLPDNESQAIKRCQSIKRRMASDEKYRNDYCNFMESLLRGRVKRETTRKV